MRQNVKENNEMKKEKVRTYAGLGTVIGTMAGLVVGVFNLHDWLFIVIGALIGFGIGVSKEKEDA